MIVDTTQFSVKRSEWSYGKGKESRIVDDNGQKDCIGFLLQASGLNSKQLVGLDEPIDVIRHHEWCTKLIEWAGSACHQTPVCYDIIKVNDDPSITLKERERKLIELFASIGITLTFTD